MPLTFKDADAVLTDPTTVLVQVRDPAGTVVAYTHASPEMTHPSVGTYFLSFVATAAGEWAYDVETTGAVTATTTGRFNVEALSIP
jgi:hypothetical protein